MLVLLINGDSKSYFFKYVSLETVSKFISRELSSKKLLVNKNFVFEKKCDFEFCSPSVSDEVKNPTSLTWLEFFSTILYSFCKRIFLFV